MAGFELAEISTTGLAIHSNYPMEPREIFQMVRNDFFIADAELVA